MRVALWHPLVVLFIAASYNINVQDNGGWSYSAGTRHISLRHGVKYTHIRQTIFFVLCIFSCFVQRKPILMRKLFLVYFVNLFMFRAYLGPSSGGTTLCIQQLVLIILFRWLSSGLHWNQDNRELSKKNNNYQLLYTYGCTSWWWT